MSDTPSARIPGAPPLGRPETTERSCRAWGCLGCLVVLLLGGGAFGVGSAVASSSLDRRYKRLQAEVASANASLPTERSPILEGVPGDTGNAVDDYRVIDWVLSGNPLWSKTAPPGAAATGLQRNDPQASGVPVILRPPAGTTLDRMLDLRDPPSPEMRRTLDRYAKLGDVIRAGVRRPRCDWGADLGEGATMPYPDFIAFRSVASYMAFEAQDQAPADALRTGLAIVGMGRDFTRHPSLIGAMIGLAIEGTGVSTMARALSRGVERGALLEADAALAALRPIDLAPAFLAERFTMQVELTRMSGRGEARGDLDFGQGSGGLVHTIDPMFFDREWDGLMMVTEGREAAWAAPRADRARLMAELEGRTSGYLYASFAMAALDRVQLAVDGANARISLARILIAAHLHRLETGAFPPTLKTLAPRLERAVLDDPYVPGAPLHLAINKDELRVWSVSDNLADDGGVGPADKADLVLATRAPPP